MMLRKIEVVKDNYYPDAWRVEHFTHDDYFLTVFRGTNAKERAEAYAKSIGA
jgi:hypothetical protein